MVRVNGRLLPFKDTPRISAEELNRIAVSIMNNAQRDQFKQSNEIDLAYAVPGLGRFRVNIFQQRGAVGIVLRVIPLKVRSLSELNLPRVLEAIALEERGLVLVTGTTGSGKSTTLAAMVDHINVNKTVHVMTVEDPIEFMIRDKRSVVNQREVGVDTASFSQALKSALRQDPDVILVGEMRDLETIETALTAAETGHLVLSTLHTLDATETISRIVSVFPPHQQRQVRLQLGATLRAVVSQRLVTTKDKKGRVAALEVLRSTQRIRELIEDKERTREIHDAIAEGHVSYQMQTFDQSLMQHFREGSISYDEALKQASNPSNFALRVQGIESASDSKWDGFDRSKLDADPSLRRSRRPKGPSSGSGAPRSRNETGMMRLSPEMRARVMQEEHQREIRAKTAVIRVPNPTGTPTAPGTLEGKSALTDSGSPRRARNSRDRDLARDLSPPSREGGSIRRDPGNRSYVSIPNPDFSHEPSPSAHSSRHSEPHVVNPEFERHSAGHVSTLIGPPPEEPSAQPRRPSVNRRNIDDFDPLDIDDSI